MGIAALKMKTQPFIVKIAGLLSFLKQNSIGGHFLSIFQIYSKKLFYRPLPDYYLFCWMKKGKKYLL